MNTLVLGLYAEGRTDERFLPIIIQRAVEQILLQRGRTVVEVVEPIVLEYSTEYPSRAERILNAARQSAGYHALIVHADADHPTPDQAMQERIVPGFDLISHTEGMVCEQLVPLIPVQATEAWMLVDSETVKSVIGTRIEAQALGLPIKAEQAESVADPKQALRQLIQTATSDRSRRRRMILLGSLYEPLARRINLGRLAGVPAYRRFVEDMTQVLVTLKFAEP